VLHALTDPDRRMKNQTPIAIAQTTRLDLRDVGNAMRLLMRRDPPLLRRDIDEKLDIEVWVATPLGAEASIGERD
jgi:hypothetical protein